MIGSLSVLGLITARQNSKRLPSKNILSLCGKPLIEWTYIASAQSKFLDQIILSSDDKALGSGAKKYGVQQPFIRPAELSTDQATTEDVMMHAITWLKENQRKKFDLVVLLQPTSPLRNGAHIDQALDAFVSAGSADSLVSVSEVQHSEWLHKVNSAMYMESVSLSEHTNQSTGKLVIPNGAIYIVKSPLFLKNKQRYTSKTLAYVMEKQYSVDIDTAADFELASRYCELLTTPHTN